LGHDSRAPFLFGVWMSKRKKSIRFVSRGGDKLDGALDVFGLDVAGYTAVDLGANVGGFTDCLLQRGANRVYAVDTGYGVLDWKLRQDDRVVVMERTNALHMSLPERVYLAVVDVGWTPMIRIVPVALDLVMPEGYVVALLKPQYEAKDDELEKGVVLPDCLGNVVDRAITGLLDLGIQVANQTASCIAGSGGNQEFLVLLKSV
jgi:23S rRNA (cytidine1920-2'-O)/16S rRNA (cytidine1409-2'-O)-methyltransferase